MIDINTPLLKAYFEALNNAVTSSVVTGFLKVWEGEEPDNVQDQAYIVLSDVNSNDSSTQSSSNRQASIQINIYTWQPVNNTALIVNAIANQVFQIIKPTPNAVLQVDGMQMLNLRDTTYRLERIGELGARKFINIIIVFTQDLFIFN